MPLRTAYCVRGARCPGNNASPAPLQAANLSVQVGQLLICHCSLCRTQSGALSVPFIALPRDQVWLGRLNSFKSEIAVRCFCGTCGTFVGMDYHEPYSIWLTLGGVTQLPNGWEAVETHTHPASHIFKESKVPWAEMLSGIEHLEKYGTYKPDPCAR